MWDGLWNIFVGTLILLAAFRVFPIKSEKNPEKVEQFYKRYGLFIKILGVAIFIWGVVGLLYKF